MNILVVGNFPNLQPTIGQKVLAVRGYDEAIERIKKTTFDVIIMTAVEGETNGMDLLRALYGRPDPCPVHVVANQPVIPANNGRKWHIENSLKAHFRFAKLKHADPAAVTIEHVRAWL